MLQLRPSGAKEIHKHIKFFKVISQKLKILGHFESHQRPGTLNAEKLSIWVFFFLNDQEKVEFGQNESVPSRFQTGNWKGSRLIRI